MKMTTPSKTKSRFERLLSEIYPRRFCKNIDLCVDCLEPRSNKNKFEFRKYGWTEFYALDYQNSSFVIFSSL